MNFFPYELTGLSPEQAGRAFAAAGVLEAASAADATRPIEEILASAARGRSLAWRDPRRDAPGEAGITDARLAQAWTDALSQQGGRGFVRLLVEPSPQDATGLALSALRLLHAPLQAIRENVPDWRAVPPDVVGMVGFAMGEPVAAAGLHPWNRPPHTGLATPRLIRSAASGSGLLIASPWHPTNPVDDLQLFQPPVLPILTTPAVTLRQAFAFGSREAGTPPFLALVPVPSLKEGPFDAAVIEALESGASLDLALSWAWARHGSRTGGPIMMLPSGSAYDFENTASHRWTSERRADLDLDGMSINLGPAPTAPQFTLRGTDRPLSTDTDFFFDIDDSALAPPPPAPAAPFPAPGGNEPERFTDLTLHRSFYYRGEQPDPARVLGAAEAFEPQSEYTLEVTIRARPTGIDADRPTPPVHNPRVGHENVEILAVLSCRQAPALRFADHALPLTWALGRDSSSAFFRIENGALPLPDPLRIEVRLYALPGLQLLDLLELRFGFGVWSKWRPEPVPAPLAPPPTEPVSYAASFHVVAEPGGFGIEAVFIRDGKPHLEAPLGRALLTDDLDALLRRVRNYWTGLVIGKMATRRALSEGGYAMEMAALVKLGVSAWRTLFGDRAGAQEGTPEAIGRLLAEAPLPPGSPVRVTLANDAETFVFPWAVLCPPAARGQPKDLDLIWGLRYVIEMARKHQPGYRRSGKGRVRIATAVDPGFAGSVDHAATLARVAAVGPGADLLDGNGLEDVLGRLEALPAADIYYFFCQGLSPGRDGLLDPDVIAEIEKVAAILPEVDRAPWQTLLVRMKATPGIAAMYTGAAAITEDALRNAAFFRDQRPIVFLNMCHSANLLPSMRSGLTRVFLERNAAAVIGTECPVTSIAADMFAEAVLGSLLQDQSIGDAVLNARRRFHTERSPLGLLYTVYGHADARVTGPGAQ